MASKLLWIFTAVFALTASASFGQDGLLEELYGRGVHAYFAGRMGEAFESLNTAIKNGSRDPRALYYRGLVLNRMGRPDEAREDFRKGAELEALGGVPYSVGRALERIQGADRTMLETHRRTARVAIYSTQSARDRARYEQNRRDEAEMLRGAPRLAPGPAPPAARPDASDPFSAPPSSLPTPSTIPAPIPIAPPPAANPPAAPDPFANPPAEAPLPAAPRPAPPAANPPAAPDPFANPPAEAPLPAAPRPAPPADDPFANPLPATPLPTTPAPAPAPPAPAPAADPFATPPPAAP